MSASNESDGWNPPDDTLGKIKYILLSVGPLAILMSASMGPGTIGSLSIAASNLGYTILWVVLLSGWLSAAVFYASGKVCALTDEMPVELINRYTHPIFTYPFLLGLVYAWYFAIMSQGNVLGATTATLVPTIDPYAGVVTIGLVALVAILFSGAGGGFNRAKLILSALVVFLAILFVYNAFYISAVIGNVDLGAIAQGAVPAVLAGGGAEVAFAGILGGSIAAGPIWYAYLSGDQGWGKEDLRFMAWDNIVIYGVLFTIFSLGVYISAAAALQGLEITGALSAAESIRPTVGDFAALVFTLGLWAAAFTSLGGLAATGAYLVADLYNNLPFHDDNIPLSIDDQRFRWIVIAGTFVGALGPFQEALPPLPLITYAMSLLIVAAPIAITIWGIALLRPSDVGEQLTGPWYLIAALAVTGVIVMYALYITLDWIFWLSVVAIVVIVARTIYLDYTGSDKLTPPTAEIRRSGD